MKKQIDEEFNKNIDSNKQDIKPTPLIMKNKLWCYLSILRDKPYMPASVIDKLRYSMFFKDQWWYDYD